MSTSDNLTKNESDYTLT